MIYESLIQDDDLFPNEEIGESLNVINNELEPDIFKNLDPLASEKTFLKMIEDKKHVTAQYFMADLKENFKEIKGLFPKCTNQMRF